VEHRLTDADLADVVYVPSELDLPDHLVIELERAGDDRRVLAHTNRMPTRVRVLEFERFGERLHAGEEELLEASRLCRDPLLEALLIVAILQDQASPIECLRDARPDLLEVERLDEVIHGAD